MIKKFRNKKGYTQQEIAKMLDISLRYYSKIEKYESIPNVIIACKLAKILDTDVYILYNIN